LLHFSSPLAKNTLPPGIAEQKTMLVGWANRFMFERAQAVAQRP
jgi:hypothetical protein